MANKTNKIDAIWNGPFAWPGYENSELPKLPDESGGGVYLWTFEYEKGYLIYCAGRTSRKVKERFKEHTRKYLNGEYNILDIDAATKGIRKVFWGWDYAKTHRTEFEARKTQLVEVASKQLAGFRIFVADLEDTERLHARLEATIMKTLYSQPPPVGSLPDKGMHLSSRNSTEPIISVKNMSKSHLFGLPETLEI